MTKCLYCDKPAAPILGNMQRCKVCHMDFLREDLERLHREIAQLAATQEAYTTEMVRTSIEYSALKAEKGGDDE